MFFNKSALAGTQAYSLVYVIGLYIIRFDKYRSETGPI
jgi:hypothetical protein